MSTNTPQELDKPKGGTVPIHKQKNWKTQGFKQNPQNINRRGRPPGLNEQLKTAVLEGNGTYRVSKAKIVKTTKNFIDIKVPTRDQIILRLLEMVEIGTNNEALKAIEVTMDRLEGKPRQTLEIDHTKDVKPLGIETIRDIQVCPECGYEEKGEIKQLKSP